MRSFLKNYVSNKNNQEKKNKKDGPTEPKVMGMIKRKT